MRRKRQNGFLVTLVLAWFVLLPVLGGPNIIHTDIQSKEFAIAEISIDSPPDLTFENGSLGETIVWHPETPNPKNYSVTRDGDVHRQGSWDGGDVTVFLNHLYPEGFLDEPSEIPSDFVFNCTVFNTDDEFVSDIVIVHVIADEAAPIIDPHDNITYEEGSFGHEIRWNITETNPQFYNVSRVSNELTSNETIIESGDWDGSNITVNVDHLNASHWYLYTLFVNDTLGYNSTSVVNVTVVEDLTAPTVEGPDNIEFEFGTMGEEIRWQAFDSNPKNYSINVWIRYNDTSYGNLTKPLHSPQNVSQPLWNFTDPDGGPIVYSLDYLYLGNYSFLIVLFDVNNRYVNHTLNITVYEDIRAPEMGFDGTQEYEEGYTGYSFEWFANETNPMSYNLTKDGEVLLNGTWRGENISISVDDFPVGEYIYNLTLRDFFNQTSFDVVTLVVTPDAHLPIVTSVQIQQAYATPTANNLSVQAYAWDLNIIRNVTVEWYLEDPEMSTTLEMTYQSNDLYSAHLGRINHGSVVHYRVIAQDNSSVQNIFDTGWIEYEVTPLTEPGFSPLIYGLVIVLGALSTLIILSMYFRTRTR